MNKSAGVERVNIFQDLPLSEDTAELGLVIDEGVYGSYRKRKRSPRVAE